MAVTELDRATLIITDFLTFAKPGLETVEQLDVSEELRHVTGILSPLANLQGASLNLICSQDFTLLDHLPSSSKRLSTFSKIASKL